MKFLLTSAGIKNDSIRVISQVNWVIPRDAQRVLPQQQSGLRAFFIASLFRGGGVKVTVTSRKVEPEERREPSSDLCIGK
jgi:hypothetical protein